MSLQSSASRTTSTHMDFQDEHNYESSQWSGVVVVGELSPWQAQTVVRLDELPSLPSNWDSYGSPPPSRAVVDSAVQLVLNMNFGFFMAPQVFPVPGGGIQMEWNCGARDLEIEIDGSGSVQYLKTEHGGYSEEGELASTDLARVRSTLSWVLG